MGWYAYLDSWAISGSTGSIGRRPAFGSSVQWCEIFVWRAAFIHGSMVDSPSTISAFVVLSACLAAGVEWGECSTQEPVTKSMGNIQYRGVTNTCRHVRMQVLIQCHFGKPGPWQERARAQALSEQQAEQEKAEEALQDLGGQGIGLCLNTVRNLTNRQCCCVGETVKKCELVESAALRLVPIANKFPYHFGCGRLSPSGYSSRAVLALPFPALPHTKLRVLNLTGVSHMRKVLTADSAQSIGTCSFAWAHQIGKLSSLLPQGDSARSKAASTCSLGEAFVTGAGHVANGKTYCFRGARDSLQTLHRGCPPFFSETLGDPLYHKQTWSFDLTAPPPPQDHKGTWPNVPGDQEGFFPLCLLIFSGGNSFAWLLGMRDPFCGNINLRLPLELP